MHHLHAIEFLLPYSKTINSTLSESECNSGLSLSPPHVKSVDTRAAVRVRTSVGVSSSRFARACFPFPSDYVCVMFFPRFLHLSIVRTRERHFYLPLRAYAYVMMTESNSIFANHVFFFSFVFSCEHLRLLQLIN